MAFRFMARMVVPTTILAAGLLLVGGIAAWYLHRLQREASSLLAASVAKVQAAEELELTGYRLHARLNEYLLTGDRAPLDGVPALQMEAAGWIVKAKELADITQEGKLIAQIEGGYRDFMSEYQQVEQRSSARKSAGPFSAYFSA